MKDFETNPLYEYPRMTEWVAKGGPSVEKWVREKGLIPLWELEGPAGSGDSGDNRIKEKLKLSDHELPSGTG